MNELFLFSRFSDFFYKTLKPLYNRPSGNVTGLSARTSLCRKIFHDVSPVCQIAVFLFFKNSQMLYAGYVNVAKWLGEIKHFNKCLGG